MKKLLLLILSYTIMSGAFAQQNINLPVPEKRPQNDGNKVIFTIKAPNADTVVLGGSVSAFRPSKTFKSESGEWTFTFDSLAPDLYDYWWEIDGVKTLDPANPYVARDISSLSNIFIIPGGDADWYQASDVPHGRIEKVWYHSETLSSDRRMTIYTPPGYDPNGEKEYPVLYLLHGMGGDEEAWQELGRAIQILDNQIAAGVTVPMIVVMPNGNAMRKAAPGFTADGMYIAKGEHSADPEKLFEKSFPEIIDYVESNYKTGTTGAQRAIAGLSMGGGHSWRISMLNPETFDYVGLFSPAVRWNGAGVDSGDPDIEMLNALSLQFRKQPKLYYIAIGKEDFLYGINKEYRNLLDSKHYPYIYKESPGGHTWTNWRHYLVDFLPRLFKD